MRDLLYYLVYGIFRTVAFLPLRVLYFVSDFLYAIVFYIAKYRKRIVYENLRNSFPEKTDDEINKIAKRFYRHLCDLIIEAVYQVGIGEEEIRRRVRYRNPEIIEKYYKQGKHVAAVMGHYGNWEWMFGFPLHTDYECISIYRQLKNPVFDRLLLKLRTRFNARLVPMKMTIRKIYELDKQGIPTLTAFMADQAPPREKAEYWVDFLNQDTPVYLGVERVARKMNMAVVYFKMNKVRRGYYEFDFIPLFDESGGSRAYEITDAHVAVLQKQIRDKPEYWLWSHRRWKIKR
jgi:Kdo2-lipid IVA lauroyltransferase/acyltransferase